LASISPVCIDILGLLKAAPAGVVGSVKSSTSSEGLELETWEVLIKLALIFFVGGQVYLG
jgi:hypothetical protein